MDNMLALPTGGWQTETSRPGPRGFPHQTLLDPYRASRRQPPQLFQFDPAAFAPEHVFNDSLSEPGRKPAPLRGCGACLRAEALRFLAATFPGAARDASQAGLNRSR